MHTDEEIKAVGYQQLASMPKEQLENVAELSIEVRIRASNGRTCRYTVFFERAVGEGIMMEKDKKEWRVRNIIRPDNLEDPQPKQNKIE